MDLTEIFMAIGLGVSFLLLYSRKKNWSTDALRWMLTTSLLLTGVIGFLIDKENTSDRGFYFLGIPFIYNCFDRWFKKLSLKKRGRDFYLYLRHSEEIDESFGAKNPHIKTPDIYFSMGLILIIIGLMICGILFFRSSLK